MIKNSLLSLTENLKSKTTNPFFGTLIIVWIIHNWKLVYTVFHFEQDTSLDMRIAFLTTYFKQPAFIYDLLWCILISIGVLIITYALLNLTRLILNFSDKVVAPFVYKITDKSSIVLKSDYQQLEELRQHFEDKYESERKARLLLRDELEKSEIKLTKTEPKKPKVIGEINRKRTVFENLIKSKNNLAQFKEMVDIVSNSIAVKENPAIKTSLKYNLITKARSTQSGYKYSYTQDGELLRDILIEENLI